MAALPDWARALGPPLLQAKIRTRPEEFVVTEQLEIDFSDDGEHDYLWLEKTGANTYWVSEQLAKHAGVKTRDVGYAGLKDRHAITRQWFSVRRPSVQGTDWKAFAAEGVRVVEQRQHQRKLRRGAHRGNAFRIGLRAADIAQYRSSLAARLTQVGSDGVPNYFGEQRFGRGGANIELGRAVLAGRRMPRNKRSIGISAVRSLEFNGSLDARVREATWNRILPGDIVNLNGTRSIFTAEAVTPELEQRCASMDIHPAACLPAIEQIGVEASSRPLRMPVVELNWSFATGVLWLEFQLRKGGFATAVLRELVALQ